MPLRLAIGLALLTALFGTAEAQIKPRILLIFDTSGSMGFDIATGEATGGDNSAEYPGDGGISRLYVAKNVIRGIVETTSEVEFSLMRYPQREGLGINNGAGRGALTGYDGLGENPLNYAGYCDGQVYEEPGFNFALLVPFAADNENQILSWMDHRENYPRNRELRAEGPTPLAETLRLGYEYFRDVLRGDPALRCRQNFVILFTDGAESCVRDDPASAVLAQTMALRAVRTPDPAGGGNVDKDVRVFVIAFAVQPDHAAFLDGIAREGGTAVDRNGQIDLDTGRAYSAADEAGLRLAFSRILAEAIPTEICDGVDDDCDGRIDEGALNACGECGAVPDEECNGADDDCDGLTDEGTRNACGGCGPLPDETCNELDDDCDGQIDENVQNACGGCGQVSDEACNLLDDDCDGQADNQPGTMDPITRVCSRNLGACREGREQCQAGRWEDCDGILPVEETCNGIDDDCDGATDEISRPCGLVGAAAVGQCRYGLSNCVNGEWGECVGAVEPSAEVCDGIDNDCDNLADEGLFNACGQCGEEPPEVCNGQDDNCDGRIDEDALCPRGYLCFFGECVQPCVNGECGGQTYCVDGWGDVDLCHSNACAGARCPAGLICNPERRQCDDPCRGVNCAEGEACELGNCVPATCRHTGCAEGQRCRADACEADPCAERACEANQFCREGECFNACLGIECGPDRHCVDGECVQDQCGGRCLRGQRCDPGDGACYTDPCSGIDCPQGTVCVDGECSADAPCNFITCPVRTFCYEGTCTDFTPGVSPRANPLDFDGGVDQGPPPEFGVDRGVVDMFVRHDLLFVDSATPDVGNGQGGGGNDCDCRASEGSPAPWFLLLALLPLMRRRRRRGGP
ncbi:MAG: hypothetical protein KC620_09975 [Myxococcales bacterium]|nr:hypothetical protein [Myxococcales bacterium]